MERTPKQFMQHALDLAARGLGNVEPNPAVGAVIVKGERIIGSGWHKKFGGPHAEINALEDCKRQGNNPKGATMYVTLEPCCHFGKRGPCTDALIAAKLKRVVVATIDPYRQVNGKGVRLLRKAGIKVDVGLCWNEARLLNAPFIKFAKTGKPWITLKWAQSADGYLARTDKERWITGPKSRKDVHKLRRQVGAILVGINTVLKDDPFLTPRPAKGKKPLRIVLDNHLRIPLGCRLLRTAGKFPVLIITRNKMLQTKKAGQIISRGAQLIGCSNMKILLSELGKRGIERLLVEGGPTVISSFLKAGLADEIVVYMSPIILGAKGRAGITPIAAETILHYADIMRFGNDIRITGLTDAGIKQINLKKGMLK